MEEGEVQKEPLGVHKGRMEGTHRKTCLHGLHIQHDVQAQVLDPPTVCRKLCCVVSMTEGAMGLSPVSWVPEQPRASLMTHNSIPLQQPNTEEWRPCMNLAV